MESVLGRLSLFRAGEMGTRIQESHLSCQHNAPTLNPGEARSAALVAQFAAGRALAVRRRLLPNKPPPSAAQRLRVPRGIL